MAPQIKSKGLRLGEHVCMRFFSLVWSEESPPKVCKIIVESPCILKATSPVEDASVKVNGIGQ